MKSIIGYFSGNRSWKYPVKSLIATIYINDADINNEIKRIINQGMQVAQIKELENQHAYKCAIGSFPFILNFNGESGLIEVVLTPFQNYKIKKDSQGNEGFDLAFYISSLLKFIRGYEVYTLVSQQDF